MNTLEKPSYNDLYEAKRTEISNTNVSYDDLDKMLAPEKPAEKQLQGSQEVAEVSQGAVDVSSLPSNEYVQEEAKKSLGTLDILSWAASPIMALGDAAAAPIADQNYPGTGVIDDAGHAFSVAGKAFMKRLLPTLGEDVPDYGAAIVENTMPELPDWSKPVVSTGINLVTDPTFTLGIGAAKAVQAGLQAKKMQSMGEMAVTNKGILEEGILKLAGFDTTIDADKLSRVGQLASKADRGDKEALKELNTVMQDQRFTEIANAVDLKETKAHVDRVRSMFGNENDALVVFENAQNMAKSAKVTKDTTHVITTAKGTVYNYDGVSTIRDASSRVENAVPEIGKKSTATYFVFPQEVPAVMKWQELQDPGKRVMLDGNKAKLMATDATTGKRVQVAEVALSDVPSAKMSPIEFFSKDKSGKYHKDMHLGSEITEVVKRDLSNFTSEGLPKMAVNINMAKYAGEGDIQAIFQATVDELRPIFESAKGPKHDEAFVREGIQQQNLKDLLGRDTQRFTPVEAAALNSILLSTARNFRSLAKVAMTSKDPVAHAAANNAYLLNAMFMEKAVGVKSAAGRSLQVQKLTAKTTRGMYKEIEDMMAQPQFQDSHYSRVLKSLAADDRLGDAQLLRFLDKSSRTVGQKFADGAKAHYDALYEAFVNAYLSGGITHAKNMTSNAYAIYDTMSKKYLGALSAGARGWVLGNDAAKVLYQTEMKQANAMMAGLAQGVSDTYRLARKQVTKEQLNYPEDLIQLHEVGKQRRSPKISSENLGYTGIFGQFVDFIGGYIRMPGEALLQEDKGFKLINYRMGVNQEAAKRAFFLAENPNDQKAIFNMFVNNPDEFMVRKARDMAELNTFCKKLGKFGMEAETLSRNPGFNMLMPFFRTPVNIAKRGTRDSFIGNAFKDVLTGDFLKGTPKGDVARANIAVGTLLPMSILAMLPDDITITGDIDTTTELGKLKADKTLPYSFTFKNDDGSSSSFSFEGLEPFRSVIGMMVNYRDIWAATYSDYKDGNAWNTKEAKEILDDAAAITVSPFLKTIKATPFFDFFGDMHDVLRGVMNGDVGAVGKRLTEIAANVTAPSLVSQSNKAEFDDHFRMAETYLEQVKKRTWGLSKDLPIRPNIFGEAQYVPRGVPFALVNPFLTKDSRSDIIAEEMIRIEVNVPRLPDSFTKDGIKVKLDVKHMSDFGVMVGKGLDLQDGSEPMPPLREHIQAVKDEDTFAVLPEGEFKDKVLKTRVEYILQHRRKAVSEYMIATYPELKAQYETAKLEQELLLQENQM